ncbi:MAG TPA: 16S rRNA (cytosine(1402)-N(4))-methyltransferase RsmH [Candidatus Ornithoclostridium faecavium]|nr:16S rRNA (cytosine(1402)-N(4))-methyltransferase RsmH [Candidatus Ornithoclostridium faecavium]
MTQFAHVPVMPGEVTEGLNIKENGIYLDCTLGGGGHSELILKKLTTGRLIAIDKDEEALAFAKSRLSEYGDKVTFVHSDFKRADEVLDDLNIDRIDGVLMDLGVSSYQLDAAERGFSYRFDAPLDMRMDKTQFLTAFNVVNEYNELDIADILFRYGEERYARKIAANIIRYRQQQSIRTTGQLAEIVEKSYPPKERFKGGNPCKRTFQAIRIEVNGELRELDEIIGKLAERLNKGGRICVITFHSLEDRIVKREFQYLEAKCICPPKQPVCTCNKEQTVKIITKKPLTASEEELAVNPRAQSAKLRVAERV